MPTSMNDQPVVDEQIWREWVQNGKRRERASIRRFTVMAGIAFLLLATGSTFYLFAVK